MLQTAHIERNINSIRTEVLLQVFADRILVLVTQLGKVGNLIQATLPSTVHLPPQPIDKPSEGNPLLAPHPSIEVTSLLGSAPSAHEQQLHSLYASQIATLVWTAQQPELLNDMRRSVIVGVALKRQDPGVEDSQKRETETFLGVMDMTRELLQKK
ncbi:hypothetical protein EVG20_g346 [Dentipellis fragilis]|uniref:Uncharacterized protein n=1 Tax=Dentipellis fragilis TaxID=205917 RepID=A0A4Y9ZCV2_9AGAM|nr:hypothetical protein EVG20_g346 [Dentipellis fragilis]